MRLMSHGTHTHTDNIIIAEGNQAYGINIDGIITEENQAYTANNIIVTADSLQTSDQF